MAASLAAEGRLANCIAVCGLSGAAAAVADQPASAAVALGLLISELSQEPWKGRVITFDETHQLHKVRGANLKEKACSARSCSWRWPAGCARTHDG